MFYDHPKSYHRYPDVETVFMMALKVVTPLRIYNVAFRLPALKIIQCRVPSSGTKNYPAQQKLRSNQ